ncbi:helix-turn-helix transcriptional regulator [Tepidiforma thermophila]|uniref:Putative ArsR family transcriptional regulator n=1 Tax=Tepidiforma thermophila (strain KCTC 52669 / CGMCC 1.13589 / G233) TaxID=2761530 RepID=A0A2A9HHK6_TEPT2|nr:helix-turn-helix transcriptional regulator [Tepidiforma thermophila]PFG75288.1 putative ArsR family transcriptional regulator [Tepidiforma thermophila]
MLGSEPPQGASINYLSPTRQALVVAIKVLGEATTDELARETFLSPGAVRQHLLSLEAQGLVTFTKVREGPGRPRHVFRLTPRGESLLPQLYPDLAVTLLAAIRGESPELLDRALAAVVEQQVHAAESQLLALARDDRIVGVLELFERFGYFPRVELPDDRSTRIVLRHCPLLKLAAEIPEVCEAECAILRAVLPGMTVERVEHRLAGDPICTYELTPDE